MLFPFQIFFRRIRFDIIFYKKIKFIRGLVNLFNHLHQSGSLQAAIRSYAAGEAVQESFGHSCHHTNPINYHGHRDPRHNGPLQALTAGALCIPGDFDLHAWWLLVSTL